MPVHGDLLRVLRALTQAASRFEKVAAKHHRIEAERKGSAPGLDLPRGRTGSIHGWCRRRRAPTRSGWGF